MGTESLGKCTSPGFQGGGYGNIYSTGQAAGQPETGEDGPTEEDMLETRRRQYVLAHKKGRYLPQCIRDFKSSPEYHDVLDEKTGLSVTKAHEYATCKLPEAKEYRSAEEIEAALTKETWVGGAEGLAQDLGEATGVTDILKGDYINGGIKLGITALAGAATVAAIAMGGGLIIGALSVWGIFTGGKQSMQNAAIRDDKSADLDRRFIAAKEAGKGRYQAMLSAIPILGKLGKITGFFSKLRGAGAAETTAENSLLKASLSTKRSPKRGFRKRLKTEKDRTNEIESVAKAEKEAANKVAAAKAGLKPEQNVAIEEVKAALAAVKSGTPGASTRLAEASQKAVGSGLKPAQIESLVSPSSSSAWAIKDYLGTYGKTTKTFSGLNAFTVTNPYLLYTGDLYDKDPYKAFEDDPEYLKAVESGRKRTPIEPSAGQKYYDKRTGQWKTIDTTGSPRQVKDGAPRLPMGTGQQAGQPPIPATTIGRATTNWRSNPAFSREAAETSM